MTVEPVIDAEIADLTNDEAAAITGRIRAWVNACPIEDIKAAFFGRVWLAMGYESWSEWCDCELDGFKLPAVERREIVAELAESGMSNRSIADVIGVDKNTVRSDLARGENSPPEQITGQDGKTYQRKPRHGNSKLQTKILQNLRGELRGVASVLEDFFPGTFEKKCTPEIVYAAAKDMRAAHARIGKVLRMLENYGRPLPTEAINVTPAGS